MKGKGKRIAAVALLLMLTLGLLTGCGKSAAPVIRSFEDVHNVRFGIQTGALDEQIQQTQFADCTPLYFSTLQDMVGALTTNKIDCLLYEGSAATTLLDEISGLVCLPDPVYREEIAMVFPKNSAKGDRIRSEFDAFLLKLEESGELAALEQAWREHYDTLEIDYSGITGERDTIVFADAFDVPPYTFIRNGERTGLELDLVVRFCADAGYALDVQSIEFSALIPSVAAGKVDFAGGSICVTEERKESVAFSVPYSHTDIYMIVRGEGEQVSFFESLAESFRKTFIEEERWKMILSGIGTTLAISCLSLIIGSVLGFLIYLLCRRGGKVFSSFFNGITWIVNSLPMVVFLMLLYYVLFGNSSISGFWVSVIAFSLFAALGVYSALSAAVAAIDVGQTEGAYSLGLSDARTFLKIVLPQAMPQFMDGYKGLIVSLVQGTSIVGYIAVEDLTRVSDMIRGRTYDAFFPIIATALIYLLLCWLLTLLIRRTEIKIDPKARSKEKIMRRFGK